MEGPIYRERMSATAMYEWGDFTARSSSLIPLPQARTLEVRKLDKTAQKTMAMLHSGPSHGGKGHKSETQHAPIPRQLKQIVPSLGVGH
ncbi:unnamed protein product [Sphenostylis stenocarpa]|uniref:Uncharacterized protein n=1 Tax=Sphenostylis stenocarpa TaxID=92480 RepID=A0AA86W2T7_9FABA|nr:unnamed protein product [Sphenostylis stenocarpa]